MILFSVNCERVKYHLNVLLEEWMIFTTLKVSHFKSTFFCLINPFIAFCTNELSLLIFWFYTHTRTLFIHVKENFVAKKRNDKTVLYAQPKFVMFILILIYDKINKLDIFDKILKNLIKILTKLTKKDKIEKKHDKVFTISCVRMRSP